MENCPICGTKIRDLSLAARGIYGYSCQVCGKVNITNIAAVTLANQPSDLKYLLSGFTRERTELGLPPIEIASTNIQEILSGANIPRTVAEKLDRLLLYFARMSDYEGMGIAVDYNSYPLAYAKNPNAFFFLLNQLKSQNLIVDVATAKFALTALGWSRVIELSKTRKSSLQAFVAMWFTPETQKAYDDGIDKAIRESGFYPVRVDKLEHNNKICDVIVAEIRKSAFLVADFTGQRQGVYFEAGFAMGLGLPVIWLCRKDYVDSTHFDTRQYNHIVWENESELHEKLLNRINATIVS
jgi:nucleoside 2-deoxyribosyltransferase